MRRLSEDQIVDLRQAVARLRDGRCMQVDEDGCRCLRRPEGHAGPCDFPWTPVYMLSGNNRLVLLGPPPRRSA
jgi:hypothetical protein